MLWELVYLHSLVGVSLPNSSSVFLYIIKYLLLLPLLRVGMEEQVTGEPGPGEASTAVPGDKEHFSHT